MYATIDCESDTNCYNPAIAFIEGDSDTARCVDCLSNDDTVASKTTGPSEAHVLVVVGELAGNALPTEDSVVDEIVERFDVGTAEASRRVRQTKMAGYIYEPSEGKLARV